MPKLSLLALATSLTLSVSPAWAQRTSANYTIDHEVEDAGGGSASSASYAEIASPGASDSVTATSAAIELSQGFTGQLYEIVLLGLDTSPNVVGELGTRQINATAIADDGSKVNAPTGIAWSVQSGPLQSVSSGGLAQADAVFEDTNATLRANLGLISADLTLTVLDTLIDNFGSYAGDGLPDFWQVDHFGLDNPDAAPTRDPDGDQQDNTLEFTAGVDPTDPFSLFSTRIEPVPGTAMRRIVFSPVLIDRTYTPLFSTNLETPWDPLPAYTTTDLPDGERAFTDTDMSPPLRKFYEIQIETIEP